MANSDTEMVNRIANEMISSNYQRTQLTVASYKAQRDCFDLNNLITTINLKSFRIDKENLILNKFNNIFFDLESYFVEWKFKLDETGEEVRNFHWRGLDASKGHSPCPENSEDIIVERLVQWSEPPYFFSSFENNLVVIKGTHGDFKKEQPHLFLIRGEIDKDLHLYEVECKNESLRSKGSFFVLLGNQRTGYVWHGKGVLSSIKLTVNSLNWTNIFKDLVNSINIKYANDEQSTKEFLSCFNDDTEWCQNELQCIPKLFYFNSICGIFLSTLVEYPLASEVPPAFPFLQSHLYSADPPAVFILDDSQEIWIWCSGPEVEASEEYSYAQKVILSYMNKSNRSNASIRTVFAKKEPAQFICLFPYWKHSK